MSDGFEDVWRSETPHVLGALVRRYADLGFAEDALQDALVAAHRQWPVEGVPSSPRAWLIRVAERRLVDRLRNESARAAREQADGVRRATADQVVPSAERAQADSDDTLLLFLLCCHPALPRHAQVSLTLRVVGGLTTAQIAAGLLLPERTIAQRITRAKRVLRSESKPFALPSVIDLPFRIAAVLDVLMLVFNEGYASSAGDLVVDVPLATEGIRLTRELHQRLPAHDEVTGALALMLLTHARTAARTDERGDLVALSEQDRSRWDRARIAEGIGLVERVLPAGPVGRYQLQAAIAAVHAEAPDAASTDWTQIAELYRMLDALAPGPAVTLNLAVAEGEADGPAAGLARLSLLTDDPAMQRHHRFFAVRAHLSERAGDTLGAARDYETAATLTGSLPEQRYLRRRRARLDVDCPAGPVAGLPE